MVNCRTTRLRRGGGAAGAGGAAGRRGAAGAAGRRGGGAAGRRGAGRGGGAAGRRGGGGAAGGRVQPSLCHLCVIRPSEILVNFLKLLALTVLFINQYARLHK